MKIAIKYFLPLLTFLSMSCQINVTEDDTLSSSQQTSISSSTLIVYSSTPNTQFSSGVNTGVSSINASMSSNSIASSATNATPSSLDETSNNSSLESSPFSSVIEQQVDQSSNQNVLDNGLPAYINPDLVDAIDRTIDYKNNATASSVFTSDYEAWQAFDAVDSLWTLWVSDSKQVFPAVIMYDFHEERSIREYRIHGRYDEYKDRLPKKWIVQGSNSEGATTDDPMDDSDWTTIDSRENIEIGSEWYSDNLADTIAFTVKDPGIYNAYRICIMEVNGAIEADIIDLYFMENKRINLMIPTVKDDIRVQTNSTYSSEYKAWKLFDGKSPYEDWTHWVSDNIVYPHTANVSYSFDEPQRVEYYTMTGRFDQFRERLPKNWVVQGADTVDATIDDPYDSSNWITVDARKDIELNTHWDSNTEVAELTFMTQWPNAFKTYRLCVFEPNGSTMSDLIEITFLKTLE